MRIALLLIVALAVGSVPAFGQDGVAQRLEASPRHQEWVTVTYGERTVHSFLVFPEVKEKAPAVVVIHEIFGLTDWVCSVADRLAEAGYIAIAPDLLSGSGPEGGRSVDFPSVREARRAVSGLPPEQVTADLNAVADYVANLPACTGTVAVGGFCWGGRQTFRFATDRKGLAAAFVFYGSGPNASEAISKIGCPVYGFYGGDDARVNKTVPGTAELMAAAEKRFEPVTYEGARHGFMRRGEDPEASEANRKARDEAWKRWKELLKTLN